MEKEEIKQRKKELRQMIKIIRIERKNLLNEQRPLTIELYKLNNLIN